MDNKTVIFGGNGYIGSVIKAKAANAKINLLSPNKKQLNLFDKIEVENFFNNFKFDKVILSVGKPFNRSTPKQLSIEYFNNNLIVERNIIECAIKYKTKNLINIGSASIYQGVTYLESTPLSEITEPDDLYAQGKLKVCKLIESYADISNSNWLNLIIPGVISFYHPLLNKFSYLIPHLVEKLRTNQDINLNDEILESRREFVSALDIANLITNWVTKVEYFRNCHSRLNFLPLASYQVKDVIDFVQAMLHSKTSQLQFFDLNAKKLPRLQLSMYWDTLDAKQIELDKMIYYLVNMISTEAYFNMSKSDV